MGNLLKSLFEFKEDTEVKIKTIKKNKKKKKDEIEQRFITEKLKIDKKISQFIEEARENGKIEAKEEIKKLEVETVEKINKENEEKQKTITTLKEDFNQKKDKMEKETNAKIDELTKLVNEALKKHHETK